MRGRPRKHAAVHMLDGTLRHNNHDLGADTRPANGECVATRQLNTHGHAEFARVMRAYPPGTLGELDSEPLTQYCEWVQKMFALRELEESTGEMLIKQAAEISKHCLHYAVRFGLTPADRGKVKLPMGGDDDKGKKFFGAAG